MQPAYFPIIVASLLLDLFLSSAAEDWSVTPASRDGSLSANSHVLVIPNIIRKQTGYLTVTNNSCGHFAVVAAGSPSQPCGGFTVRSFAKDNRCSNRKPLTPRVFHIQLPPRPCLLLCSPTCFSVHQVCCCCQRRRLCMVQGLAYPHS
jgi:hypothetical protein